MNWGGLSTPEIQAMYEEAVEFLRADAQRHKSNGRQLYAEELNHHLDVIEERVTRLRNTVKALMPSGSPPPVEPRELIHPGRGGRPVKVGEVTYPSMTAAARELNINKHTISRMIRDGKAKWA